MSLARASSHEPAAGAAPGSADRAALARVAHDAAQANRAARAQTIHDERDKRAEEVAVGLMARARVIPEAAAAASRYRGTRLVDIAKESLTRAGCSSVGMTPDAIVLAALTGSSSDFPVILETAIRKTLQAAYSTAPATWPMFCARGSVSDFRDATRYRQGSFGVLAKKNELGEFRKAAIPDGEKATVRAGTKGNIVSLSRQAIVNDDLRAFLGLTADLGRAAARTVEADVFALLAENAGLGPLMPDGKTLFHADHGNVGPSASLTMESVDADRVVMALQMDPAGAEFLDLAPAVLVVPLSLEGAARAVNEAVYDPDTTGIVHRPNFVRGLFRSIVSTPRMTGERRVMFADPQVAPVLEVAFLDGRDAPYIEGVEAFNQDGRQYLVRLDYGVAAVDHRGAVLNVGAD